MFVRFRIPHVFIHITLTSLTFKPSFVRCLSNPHIGLCLYLEKLKIRVETRNNTYKREVIFLSSVYICIITWLIQTHRKVKLFSCPMYRSVYSNLKTHLQMHTGEKTFFLSNLWISISSQFKIAKSLPLADCSSICRVDPHTPQHCGHYSDKMSTAHYVSLRY